MIAVTTALTSFFGFVILRVTTPQMTTLFTELSIEDSSAIIKDLERQAIPYELKNDGAAIMVPKDKVTRLRMKLAEGGLPKGGGVGYEIFDKSEALGTSSFVQNVNHLRALEGELARTIASIGAVDSARVHLVLAQRELFSRDKQEPSASIVIKTRGSERLGKSQVAAIQHLVAAAVPSLRPGRISIVDSEGNLLARGTDEGADAAGGTLNTEELRTGYEQRLSRSIEEMLERSVGPGKVRAEVHAEMDFDRL